MLTDIQNKLTKDEYQNIIQFGIEQGWGRAIHCLCNQFEMSKTPDEFYNYFKTEYADTHKKILNNLCDFDID